MASKGQDAAGKWIHMKDIQRKSAQSEKSKAAKVEVCPKLLVVENIHDVCQVHDARAAFSTIPCYWVAFEGRFTLADGSSHEVAVCLRLARRYGHTNHYL